MLLASFLARPYRRIEFHEPTSCCKVHILAGISTACIPDIVFRALTGLNSITAHLFSATFITSNSYLPAFCSLLCFTVLGTHFAHSIEMDVEDGEGEFPARHRIRRRPGSSPGSGSFHRPSPLCRRTNLSSLIVIVCSCHRWQTDRIPLDDGEELGGLGNGSLSYRFVL